MEIKKNASLNTVVLSNDRFNTGEADEGQKSKERLQVEANKASSLQVETKEPLDDLSSINSPTSKPTIPILKLQNLGPKPRKRGNPAGALSRLIKPKVDDSQSNF
eukprot:Platyproteum_vivax@DN3270_c0_g1_i2.p1